MRWLCSIFVMGLSFIGFSQDEHPLPPADANLSSYQLQQWNDDLEYYQNDPMSLCESDPNVLADHPLLTFQQAVNLTYYTHRSGCILDWGELGNIKGFSREWIEIAKPYFTLAQPQSGFRFLPKYYTAKLRLGFKVNGPVNKGTTTGAYPGPSFQDGGSLILKAQPYEIGLRWQRDAEEPWLSIQRGIWDYWSGYAIWRPTSSASFGIGSYRLGFGTGLLVGSAFGGRRISSLSDLHRRVSSSRMSASAMESGQWTGFTSVYHRYPIGIRVAIGRSKLDARIESDTISTLYSTGWHRTKSERAFRKTVEAWNSFVELSYSLNNFKLSGAFNYIKLSHPYGGRKEYGGTSLHLQYLLGALHIESETAIDSRGRFALIGSVSKAIDDHTIGLRIENITLDYQPHPIQHPPLLVSGNGVLSMQAFWQTRFYGGETSLLLFAGRGLQKRSTPLEKWGWEWKISKRIHSVLWSSTARQTVQEGTSYYVVQRLEFNTPNPMVSLRWNGNFNRVNAISQSYAVQAIYTLKSHQITGQIYAYNDAGTGHNTWLYTPTTSMQMRIAALSGRGVGVSLKWTWELTNQHSVQIASYSDERVGAIERGSGNDQSRGNRSFSIVIEYHWKLGNRNS
ncbi:hypothetical protein [Phaeocystidibacter marisrubri]|uniref:Helix-hairpin-helix domain-containing protein n=1 Tax=Phaeocystidibacter marisrubri TaxID=1577780 RepID=A0A6L3ZDM6_9FLAO|nr:hypothetical protein [Phaeocystidibacter marisrubri]KAB2815945.1 hypothetical protein F8C82_09620 [Phaeocystidibacter marisrubri]